jgi:hypothetical protein
LLNFANVIIVNAEPVSIFHKVVLTFMIFTLLRFQVSFYNVNTSVSLLSHVWTDLRLLSGGKEVPWRPGQAC